MSRDYRLDVRFRDGTQYTIKDIRIVFSVLRSIYIHNNTADIQIYGLARDKQQKLFREREDKNNDISVALTLDNEPLFIGNVFYGYTERDGADLITKIFCVSLNAAVTSLFVAETTTENPQEVLADRIVARENETKQGEKLSKGEIKQVETKRPVVLVGNATNLMERYLESGDVFFTEDNKISVVAENARTSDDVVVVDSEQLFNTPIRKTKKITFRTLINPKIKLGKLISLKSRNTDINGAYYVHTVDYTGDNFGNSWFQDTVAQLREG